jgi:hypothetical protein
MDNGRPTKYNPIYNEQVIKLCRLGATDKDLASFFNVCEATINNWKKEDNGFLESLRAGKMEADNEVANSLYKRATGYEHEDTYLSNYEGRVSLTPYIKRYPPDATSMIFWLKNRRPDLWRDKQELDANLSGNITVNIIKKL